MFTGLRHGAVSSGNNQDGTVHLSSTGDHILYIVSVPRAVNVCIVSGLGFIFNVGGINGNTTFSFFRSLIDVSVSFESGFAARSFGQDLGDGRSQGRLAMVNVTNGPNVYMGFCSFKFLFRH